MSNMNLVCGLALHEFSVAQVDSVCMGGHMFESCWDSDFSLSHAHDILIISFSQVPFVPQVEQQIKFSHHTTSNAILRALMAVQIKILFTFYH